VSVLWTAEVAPSNVPASFWHPAGPFLGLAAVCGQELLRVSLSERQAVTTNATSTAARTGPSPASGPGAASQPRHHRHAHSQSHGLRFAFIVSWRTRGGS